jgi:hypothetical protein
MPKLQEVATCLKDILKIEKAAQDVHLDKAMRYVALGIAQFTRPQPFRSYLSLPPI